MIESAAEYVTLRHSQEPGEYNRTNRDRATDTVWLELINNLPQYKIAAAQNHTISTKILGLLANDDDAEVRHRVAMHPGLSPVLFEVLSRDIDELVRGQVARNSNTPIRTLKFLLQDKSEMVINEAKDNLSRCAE